MYGGGQYHKNKISLYGINILYTFTILKLCLAIRIKKLLLVVVVLTLNIY